MTIKNDKNDYSNVETVEKLIFSTVPEILEESNIYFFAENCGPINALQGPFQSFMAFRPLPLRN